MLMKVYHVQIHDIPTESVLDQMRRGVVSDGETLSVLAVKLLRSGEKNAWLEVVLDEGRNRQIRRILDVLGIEVLRLIRISIGPLQLGIWPRDNSATLRRRKSNRSACRPDRGSKMGDRFSTPVPAFPSLRMAWCDLLFAHWRVDAAVIRSLLPRTNPPMEVDEFDGSAWIGVVPFRMAEVRWSGLPSFPGTGEFPELNVRTYVRAGGRPGVWFFSLDAASRLAVRAARIGFHLPYFDARMRCESSGEGLQYSSQRTHRGGERRCSKPNTSPAVRCSEARRVA
jgi:uncharacterized protein YqjF (DUF2071 family)